MRLANCSENSLASALTLKIVARVSVTLRSHQRVVGARIRCATVKIALADITRRDSMPRYSVFLGFELETETAEAARDAAREMIERRVEFPEVVSCVGVETPPCRLPTIEYMVALVHAMHDEAIRHAAKSN